MFHIHSISYFVYSLSFTVITILYFFLNSFFAFRSNKKPSKGKSIYNLSDVTAVIPVYNEDIGIFEKVVKSVYDIGIEFIVVGDGSLEPYKSITEKYHGKFVYLKEHKGKRHALAEGIKNVYSPLVLFLDSDTIIDKGSLLKLLSSFDENVGGVGPNIRIMYNRKNKYAYYYSEFFERLSEMVNRAINYFGNSIILSGQCVIYRTEIVKPYITSKEFLEPKMFGKNIVISDDRDLTDYIIKKGYKAVKVFDAVAYTKPPKDIKVFTKQVIRWTRANYLNFLREIIDGSISKRGTLYVFDMIYANLLPLFTILFMYLEFERFAKLLSSLKGFSMKIINIILLTPLHYQRPDFLFYFTHFGGIIAVLPFILVLVYLIPEDRLKTLIYGSVALAVQYIASLYALFTFLWQDWLTR